MANFSGALYNLNFLEELADKKTPVHRIHPLAKLLTTVTFLVTAVSFGKYEISAILPLILYPVLLMSLGEIPLLPLFKRMLVAAPFIVGIGIFNPLFDPHMIVLFPGWQISAGWLSFLSLLLKGGLTVAAALLLIATTGMGRIAQALRMIWVPRVFVMQILLTYRYINVLIDEAARTSRAYALRSPLGKGIRFAHWGSLAGHLLLKTFDRAERVFQSMRCRGFAGEFPAGPVKRMMPLDILFFAGWSLFFVLVRYVDIPSLLGSLMTGGGK